MIAFDISIDGIFCEHRQLDAERTTIGRRAECSIQLLDPTVSGEHALVTTVLEEPWIEDLGSTNGTYVNGVLIRKQLLVDGDTVDIGQHRLQCCINTPFDVDLKAPVSVHAPTGSLKAAKQSADSLEAPLSRAAAQSLEDEFERTMRRLPAALSRDPVLGLPVRASRPDGQVRTAPDNAALSTTIKPVAWLELKTGPHAGQRLRLDRNHFRLGASRQRLATVSREASGYVLLPEPGNGAVAGAPLVNGEPADSAGSPLQHRDIVEVGGVEMEFSVDA